MKKLVFQEFDGYSEIVEDIETSRRYGIDYSAEKDSPEQYIHLLHPPRLELRVSDIFHETPSAKTLRLVSTDHYLPPFQAGQYIALFLEIDMVRTIRPYSISSPPNQTGYYDITVKQVEGGLVSNYLLDEIKRGHILRSSGPAGNFYFNPLFHDKTMVCLAGGSGITPFMSMIRELVDCGLDRSIYLFYGNKSPDDVIFDERLKSISERSENVHYFPVIENPGEGYKGHRGLITAELIGKMLADLSDKTFYLCGPQGLYDYCIPVLEKLGIPKRKIRQEVYGTPAKIFDNPGWPQEVNPEELFTIEVKGHKTLHCRAGEPLLAVLEKAGLVVPSLCRSGECSMCRVKVLSGKVFQPPGALVRKSDRQFGYIHSCVSYPLEDLEILI
jgi:ferredoxin-NADP reductase